MGKYSQSLRCYEKALDLQERVTGVDSDETITLHVHIAQLHLLLDNKKMAYKHFNIVLQRYEQVLGPQNPETGAMNEQLATICEQQGRIADAIKHYQQALAAFDDTHGLHERIHVLQEKQRQVSIIWGMMNLTAVQTTAKSIECRKTMLTPRRVRTQTSLVHMTQLVHTRPTTTTTITGKTPIKQHD